MAFPGRIIILVSLIHYELLYSDVGAGALHSIIVYPQSTEDVVKIVKVATKYRIPVIPYSGATSLEGQTRGVRSNLPSASLPT